VVQLERRVPDEHGNFSKCDSSENGGSESENGYSYVVRLVLDGVCLCVREREILRERERERERESESVCEGEGQECVCERESARTRGSV